MTFPLWQRLSEAYLKGVCRWNLFSTNKSVPLFVSLIWPFDIFSCWTLPAPMSQIWQSNYSLVQRSSLSKITIHWTPPSLTAMILRAWFFWVWLLILTSIKLSFVQWTITISIRLSLTQLPIILYVWLSLAWMFFILCVRLSLSRFSFTLSVWLLLVQLPAYWTICLTHYLLNSLLVTGYLTYIRLLNVWLLIMVFVGLSLVLMSTLLNS